MAEWYYKEYFSHLKLHNISEISKEFEVHGATGHLVNIYGYIEAEVMYPGLSTPVMALMLVVDTTNFSKNCCLIT